jgi:hypothetical protein
MTYAAYIPKPGSLAESVLAYMMTNPDEELTSIDISIKFDRPLHSITTGLKTAVYWQHLVCETGTQHKPSVFRLGPARRRMLDNATSAAPSDAQAAASGACSSNSNVLCSFSGQGLEVSRMPSCLRVSSGLQVLDLSAAQVSTLALIGPVLMGQMVR